MFIRKKVMKVKSLGYRTDLIFHGFDGKITDRGDYLVIQTPKNPEFYWGNFLLFSQPPQAVDIEQWRTLFKREIGGPPEVEHQVFGWDSPSGEEGDIRPFIQAEFRPTRDIVMTSSAPHIPARPCSEIQVRALEDDGDWAQALENTITCREPDFEESDHRIFKQKQMERYRMMAASGLGDWYGAFIGERLVADLGIFHDNEVARYQNVETHPDFRRRGIAGTMVYEASRQAIDKYDLETLVIVAEEGSNAARLYQSLGFQQTETQVGLEWWPKIAH
jgi:ribosomal protein S18 acetylase RimI-like enzyme